MCAGTRFILVIATTFLFLLTAHSQSDMVDQMTTPERLQKHVWWPTKRSNPPDHYVGDTACAACHAGIAKAQATSEMAQTLIPADRSTFLTSYYGKSVKVDGYSYQIFRGPQGAAFR